MATLFHNKQTNIYSIQVDRDPGERVAIVTHTSTPSKHMGEAAVMTVENRMATYESILLDGHCQSITGGLVDWEKAKEAAQGTGLPIVYEDKAAPWKAAKVEEQK